MDFDENTVKSVLGALIPYYDEMVKNNKIQDRTNSSKSKLVSIAISKVLQNKILDKKDINNNLTGEKTKNDQFVAIAIAEIEKMLKKQKNNNVGEKIEEPINVDNVIKTDNTERNNAKLVAIAINTLKNKPMLKNKSKLSPNFATEQEQEQEPEQEQEQEPEQESNKDLNRIKKNNIILTEEFNNEKKSTAYNLDKNDNLTVTEL
jgi:hypothetical protein